MLKLIFNLSGLLPARLQVIDGPLHHFQQNLKYECKTPMFRTLVRHGLQDIYYIHAATSLLQIEVHFCTRYKHNSGGAHYGWVVIT